jgi:predicted nuclease of restriction endonuclease-like RecB superfamily
MKEPVFNTVSEQEFLIKVHEAMACAYGEVPANLLPDADLEKVILKMAPYVAHWLLEDFNISDKP